MSDTIEFGRFNADGTHVHERTLPRSAIIACPNVIMVPSHYREDNSCKCDDAAERAMMIRGGYKKRHFKNIPLRS